MDVKTFSDELLKMASNTELPIEQIENYISEFYKTKPLPIANYMFDSVTRCSINEPNEIFKNTNRCSYNPFVKNIPLLRCNYKEQQVFYAAVPTTSITLGASTTAILETTMEHIRNHDIKKYHVTLSRWNIVKPIPLYIFPFSKKCIQRNVDFQVANENYNRVFADTFGSQNTEAVKYFKDSLEFMSDVFCESENKSIYYRISAAFYNCLTKFARNKNIPICGVMYPSANTMAHGINVVLQKELLDLGILKCDYVQMYASQRSPTNPMNIEFHPVSEGQIPDENGNFTFENII